jgi:hypothetical protein
MAYFNSLQFKRRPLLSGLENAVFRTKVIGFPDIAIREKYRSIDNKKIPEFNVRRYRDFPGAVLPFLDVVLPEPIKRIGKINLLRSRQIEMEGHLIVFQPVKPPCTTGYHKKG